MSMSGCARLSLWNVSCSVYVPGSSVCATARIRSPWTVDCALPASRPLCRSNWTNGGTAVADQEIGSLAALSSTKSMLGFVKGPPCGPVMVQRFGPLYVMPEDVLPPPPMPPPAQAAPIVATTRASSALCAQCRLGIVATHFSLIDTITNPLRLIRARPGETNRECQPPGFLRQPYRRGKKRIFRHLDHSWSGPRGVRSSSDSENPLQTPSARSRRTCHGSRRDG